MTTAARFSAGLQMDAAMDTSVEASPDADPSEIRGVDAAVATADADSQTVDDVPAIDRAHLARYGFTDPAVEQEILGLFAEQVTGLLAALKADHSLKNWRYATHSIKGAGRSVGAWRVAKLAGALEQIGPDAQDAHAVIAALDDAVADALSDIVNMSTPAGDTLPDRARPR